MWYHMVHIIIWCTSYVMRHYPLMEDPALVPGAAPQMRRQTRNHLLWRNFTERRGHNAGAPEKSLTLTVWRCAVLILGNFSLMSHPQARVHVAGTKAVSPWSISESATLDYRDSDTWQQTGRCDQIAQSDLDAQPERTTLTCAGLLSKPWRPDALAFSWGSLNTQRLSSRWKIMKGVATGWNMAIGIVCQRNPQALVTDNRF